MSDVLRLVYASKINCEPIAKGAVIESVVKEILTQSRHNNGPRNIGGVLCYGDGFFFQCLEGERCSVEGLYDRILLDERHRDVTLLSKRPVPQRMFQLWSMKFKNVDSKIRRMLQIEKLETFEPHQFSDLMVERLLVELRDAAEQRGPVTLSQLRSGTGARQAGATRELMPGLMFATAAGVIAIAVGLMLAGLL